MIKRSDLAQTFGTIDIGGDPQWVMEDEHMILLPVPTELQPFLLFEGKLVSRIYCNKEMASALSLAFGSILDRGLKAQVKEYGGCFMIRRTRGEDTPSVHCWGMALDLNPSTNQLGSDGDMSPELVKCFTDQGFVWGGTFKRKDPMHFQFVSED